MEIDFNSSQCWKYSFDLRVEFHHNTYIFFDSLIGEKGARIALHCIGFPMAVVQTAIEIVAAVAIIFESLVKAGVHLFGAVVSDNYTPTYAAKHFTVACIMFVYTPFGVTVGNVICLAGYTLLGKDYVDFAKQTLELFGSFAEGQIFQSNSNRQPENRSSQLD